MVFRTFFNVFSVAFLRGLSEKRHKKFVKSSVSITVIGDCDEKREGCESKKYKIADVRAYARACEY